MSRRYPRGARPRLAKIDDGSTSLMFHYRSAMYYWLAASAILIALVLLTAAW